MTAAVVNATAFTNEHFPRLLALLKTMGDRARFDSEQSDLYCKFIEQFPLDSLPNLTLEEYCVGKGDGNSFCWWIERGLQPVLARYMPGTSRGHLLYFQKDGAVYKHQRLAELGDEGALRYTLKVQHCVAAADPDGDLSWIDNDEALYKQAGVEPRVTMGHGRKLRLVTCYHPKRMLPISSCEHLGHFLTVLGWPKEDIPAKHQPMARMQRLMRYYDLARESLPELTPYGFMLGLYDESLGLAPPKADKDDSGSDDEDDTMSEANDNPVMPKTNAPLNQIFFGPPGTGKTYHTINKALAILDPECLAQHDDDVSPEARKALKTRFDELVKEGRIDFVTFHQSFSYEDFVEGIRAVTGEDSQLEYKVEAGVFKRICDQARVSYTPVSVDVRSKPRIWKISIDGTSSREAKSYCLKHGEARIGWGNTGDLKALDESTNSYYQSLGSNDRSTLRSFAQEIVIGDILVCIRSAEQIEAVGVVTSDYRFEEPDAIPVMVRSHYNHVRSVKWLYHDVGLSILPLNDDTRFTLKTVYPLDRFSWGDLLMYLQENGQQPVVTTQSTLKKQPYVLVIDEINRGNVSRIFGELITLIEPSKRAGADEALTATLPYSKRPFSVPDNLYLIGTMNTADRSLAGLDIALRRRFEFCEMPPRPELLDAVEVQGLNIGKLLRTLNQRIEVLLDRDHCLGHAYFMPLKKDCSLSRLELIFRNQILPLLQEYFFEDWQRIQWVLNDHRKPALDRFVEQDKQDVAALFGNISVPAQGAVWRINDKAFKRLSAYAGVIAANAKTEEPAEEPGEASA
ncbi:AAA family ATPase [Aeromonas sp. 2MA4]|uniref:AAA family ATPase n=1 Tax=Aeromonas sp. 2MA4 TaxID=2699195 RepID=UPI0023DDAA77|nr:AAA family ATPase [Aeromonas sp. 2MA4]